MGTKDIMTLLHEKIRAIKWAREFLRDLLDPSKTKRIPREIRQRARSVLKHYPHDYSIDIKKDHVKIK